MNNVVGANVRLPISAQKKIFGVLRHFDLGNHFIFEHL